MKTSLKRLKVGPPDIWNEIEIGVKRVCPYGIVGRRCFQHIERMTSAQREILVTVTLAVDVAGNYISPFLILSRVKFHSVFIRVGTWAVKRMQILLIGW